MRACRERQRSNARMHVRLRVSHAPALCEGVSMSARLPVPTGERRRAPVKGGLPGHASTQRGGYA